MAAFGVAVSVGALVAIPGAVLVNQEWQIVATNVYSSDFQIDDRPISNATVMAYSLATAGLLALIGVASLIVGFRNGRNNRTCSAWQS